VPARLSSSYATRTEPVEKAHDPFRPKTSMLTPGARRGGLAGAAAALAAREPEQASDRASALQLGQLRRGAPQQEIEATRLKQELMALFEDCKTSGSVVVTGSPRNLSHLVKTSRERVCLGPMMSQFDDWPCQ